MKLSSTATIIILLILTAPVFAQQQIQLSGERIQTGQRSYEYIMQTDTSNVVFASLNEWIEKKDGIVKIRMRQNLPRFVMTDSLTLDIETFAPIKYGSYIKDHQSNYVDYSNLDNVEIGIDVSFPQMTRDTSYSVALREIRYDAHWHTVLLYGLELAIGFNAELPVYTYSRGQETHGIEVTGKETLHLYGNTYEAWKVKVTRERLPNSEVWIDKKTGLLLKDKSIGFDGVTYLIQYKERS